MKKGDEVYLKVEVDSPPVNGWMWVITPNGMIACHETEVVIPKYEEAEFRVGRDAPATSKAVEPKIREGSLQEHMLLLFQTGVTREGWTDDELEQAMGRTHQSVSACRNTLARKGLIAATAQTRKTRSGNDAIVWVRTGVQVTP